MESAEEMWDAYSTIDSVVKQCENLGKPMVAGMARWGINIFGASTDGEVDAVALDDSSDTSSTRDSGYHTPKIAILSIATMAALRCVISGIAC